MPSPRRPAGEAGFAFTEWQSPIGPLLLAAHGGAIVHLTLPAYYRKAVLADLAARFGAEPAEHHLSSPGEHSADSPIGLAVGQLDEYFAGKGSGFTVPVETGLPQGFRRAVLEATSRIPFGETRSYADLASAAGSPRAVRAAGSALASNPVALLIPCHRVVRSNGDPGRYGGGSELKRRLLAMEASTSA